MKTSSQSVLTLMFIIILSLSMVILLGLFVIDVYEGYISKSGGSIFIETAIQQKRELLPNVSTETVHQYINETCCNPQWSWRVSVVFSLAITLFIIGILYVAGLPPTIMQSMLLFFSTFFISNLLLSFLIFHYYGVKMQFVQDCVAVLPKS